MRDAGRIGPDELRTEERAFAVGDQVICTRNDRSLDVVNGQRGTVAELGERGLTVDLEAERRVELPRRYASDGDLDHGYAITAHRAQGATVDRAFVLGSDELYREWGYTAMSRHRVESRFYVSAQPDFLNQAPEPIRAGDDATREVARMLRDSRAEHLALHGVKRDYVTERLSARLDEARQHLADVGSRLDALAESATTRAGSSAASAASSTRPPSAGSEAMTTGRARSSSSSTTSAYDPSHPNHPSFGAPTIRSEPSSRPSLTARSVASWTARSTPPWTAPSTWASTSDMKPALDPESIDAIAQEVADLIEGRRDHEDRALLTAGQVAARFNVDRSWVYAHAHELGVVRIGFGQRPRLRFDPAIVAQRLLARPAIAQAAGTPRVGVRGHAPLLPIKPSHSRRTLG